MPEVSAFVSLMKDTAFCLVAQSCPTLCNPMDCSPPGSSVHGIFQARILKQSAISFSRGLSWPRDQTWVFWVSCIGRPVLSAEPPGKPAESFMYSVLMSEKINLLRSYPVSGPGQQINFFVNFLWWGNVFPIFRWCSWNAGSPDSATNKMPSARFSSFS